MMAASVGEGIEDTTDQNKEDQIEPIHNKQDIEEVKQVDENLKSGGSANEEVEEDRHPEKRMKAAYMKFEEERMPELRKEYPTLKMSQLKEKLWKEVRISIGY